MIEFLRNWVINIVSLVIFIMLLEILVPTGKIKKLVNMVSGFILIVAIINPFLGLFSKKIDLKDFQFASSNMMDRIEIEADSKILKEKQMKQITEVYRKKIIKQVEESTKEVGGIIGAKADVLINEDYNSSSFGEIKRVYLDLNLSNDNNTIKPVVKVEKVEITSNSAKVRENKKQEVKNNKVADAIKNQMENKICQLLGVQKDNVIISLQEK